MMLSVLDVLQKFLFLFMFNIFIEFSHLKSKRLHITINLQLIIQSIILPDLLGVFVIRPQG